MKRIVTVLGARPQFIKAAALSREITQREGWEEIIIHTGQHFDDSMSEVFFRELELVPPDYHLGIHSLGHGAMTGRMMEEIENILHDVKPDLVCVYGDTNSTLAGALAAVKLHIHVAHVEAGLRSFNRRMPEEINRIVTDHVSDLLFTPTQQSKELLLTEGIPGERIHVVGDIMFDTLQLFRNITQGRHGIARDLNVTGKRYFLGTIHRAENTDNPEKLREIFGVLTEVAEKVPVVIPLHPRTRKKLDEFQIVHDRITAIDPVGYLDMVELQMHASLIITDSGGVQKEAYFHRVPCVTVREETEWVELVDQGWNTLAPPDSFGRVMRNILKKGPKPGNDVQLYGDGTTASRIVDQMISYTGEGIAVHVE